MKYLFNLKIKCYILYVSRVLQLVMDIKNRTTTKANENKATMQGFKYEYPHFFSYALVGLARRGILKL